MCRSILRRRAGSLVTVPLTLHVVTYYDGLSLSYCRRLDSSKDKVWIACDDRKHAMLTAASKQETVLLAPRSLPPPLQAPSSITLHTRERLPSSGTLRPRRVLPVRQTTFNQDIHSCTVPPTLPSPRDVRSLLTQRAQHASDYRRCSPLTARRPRVRHQHTLPFVPARQHGLCNHRRGVSLLEPPATDRS